MRKIEIETQPNDERPGNVDWQLLVNGECMAGGEEESQFEAVRKAARTSYEYDSDPNSPLFVNGEAI